MPSHPYPVSDHFDGQHFFNTPRDPARNFWQLLKWYLNGRRAVWPKSVANTAAPQVASSIPDGEIAVTFVNHATLLLQLPGHNLVTDPVWSRRASPFQWMGPKRVRLPGLAFSDLPPIHTALISHNHYDHLDKNTVRQLEKSFHPKFLVALGDRRTMLRYGARDVLEMDWWQEVRLSPRLRVVFTPCRHWSGRSFNDRYASLWGAFLLLTGEQKIYFGGDAGYSPWYQEMYRRYGPIDLAFLPIGAYEPRWFMRPAHMNPEEAVQAHIDLHARRSIGIHYGTFQLTDEPIDEPLKALGEAKLKFGITDTEFNVLQEGETAHYTLTQR